MQTGNNEGDTGMKENFSSAKGKTIVLNLVGCIQANVDFLSEVDGKIGDGDHGINMNKGFTIAGKRMEGVELNLSEALDILGDVLVSDIGGSMGPIYGSFFMDMAESCREAEEIDKHACLLMFQAGLEAVQTIGSAKLGDKTMLDTLIPAVSGLEQAVEKDESFSECLETMSAAARAGMESTKDMVAKVGRSARLGERSRGVLDAGSVSCFLILEDMAKSMKSLL
jgi:phosphoenolpyruvate---glycerone phosphotransferase subunit DhaL